MCGAANNGGRDGRRGVRAVRHGFDARHLPVLAALDMFAKIVEAAEVLRACAALQLRNIDVRVVNGREVRAAGATAAARSAARRRADETRIGQWC